MTGPAVRRVRLERPSLRREQAFLAAARRSRKLHGVFVEVPASAEQYAAYLCRQWRPTQASFFVVDARSDELAGVVNVNDIVLDARWSGSLGYYAFEPYAGRGLMREAVPLVIAHAFGALKLRRLEASIQPSNTRSIALVESLGFTLEETSPRCLKIRGRWREHQRWALLAEDWRGVSAGPRPAERRRQVQTSSTASTADVSTSSAAAAAERPRVNAASRS